MTSKSTLKRLNVQNGRPMMEGICCPYCYGHNSCAYPGENQPGCLQSTLEHMEAVERVAEQVEVKDDE